MQNIVAALLLVRVIPRALQMHFVCQRLSRRGTSLFESPNVNFRYPPQ